MDVLRGSVVIKPWLFYQDGGLNTRKKKGFLIISEETPVCPECMCQLALRDHKERIHKLAGGEKQWYMIPRWECKNEDCPCRLHSGIPNNLTPYKHYDAEVIEDVIDDRKSSEDIETEDYPCEQTMQNWKAWIEKNRVNIDGQLRSIGYRLLEFGYEFLNDRSSLLEELKKRICPGWLKVICQAIWNTGGRIASLGCLQGTHPLLFVDTGSGG